MSKRYPGNFITGNPVALSQTSNSGVWDLKDQYQATGNDTWQETDGIYEIQRSLRFRASASNTLTRTNIVAGNQKTWTMSFWFKRGRISSTASAHDIMGCYAGVNNDANNFEFRFVQSDKLEVCLWNYVATSNAVFRDTTAWYHIVLTLDTTVATGPKVKLYVNGVGQVWGTDSISPNTAANANLIWNATTIQYLGRWQGSDGGNYFLDGYMTELNFVDGQALDASYFGYFDPITNIWQPKRYTGNYGKTGYYLPFNDNYNVYGLGNDKKPTTSIGVYLGTGGIPNTAVSSLQGAESKFGGTALQLIGYCMPGGLDGGYGLHNPIHNVDGKDFTIEFWYKGTAGQTNFGSIDGVLTGYNYFASKGRTNTSSTGWGVRLYSDGNIAWDTYGNSGGNSGSVFTTGQNVLDNNWHHIAITRSSGTVRIFIDGTLRGSGSLNLTCNNTYGLVINGMWDYSNGANVTYKVGGYMDDFRMYTGIAKYTSNFTAPTAPLPIGQEDQYWGYVSCAIPFDQVNVTTSIPCWIPNYWTPNNFSLTAGVTYDSMVDSPTNIPTTATDVGGVVSGNYCTLSPLHDYMNQQYYQAGTSVNQANSNFYDLGNGGNNNYCFGSMPFSTGKFYWEVTPTAGVQYLTTGISFRTDQTWYTGTIGGQGIGYGNGSIYSYDSTGTTRQSSLTVLANNQVLGVAVDADNKTIQFYIQGNAIGTAQSYSAYDTKGQGLVVPHAVSANMTGTTATFNFGQRAFAYAPPAGYKSLCTTNMAALGSATVGTAALKPNNWFDINLYGGTGAPRDITNSGFQPNLVWIKHRSSAENNNLYDTARGAGSRLESNSADVETNYTDRLTSFNNNGFSLGGGYNNTAGTSYDAWQWKQSPTAGFNIITWTGTGAGTPQAITHNLGVTPAVIICKAYSGASQYWIVHHKDHTGITYNQYLQLTDTQQNDSQFTAKSNSTITVNGGSANAVGIKYVGYLFASVPGFSDFGMYVGNESSAGTVVYTGFRPRYVLIKSSTVATSWYQFDSARESFNEVKFPLFPNTTATEATNVYGLDFLSNGFKIRAPNGYGLNNSGRYIYFAFAESPFGLNNRAR